MNLASPFELGCRASSSFAGGSFDRFGAGRRLRSCWSGLLVALHRFGFVDRASGEDSSIQGSARSEGPERVQTRSPLAPLMYAPGAGTQDAASGASRDGPRALSGHGGSRRGPPLSGLRNARRRAFGGSTASVNGTRPRRSMSRRPTTRPSRPALLFPRDSWHEGSHRSIVSCEESLS